VQLTAAQWTERCRDRIEIARLALVKLDPAFASAKLDVESAPWHPTLHFEARTGEAGIWWANVERGKHPCSEQPDQRGFSEWRDNPSTLPMVVARSMRFENDVAWLEAANVPENTAIAFRREMQFALRECLLDARGVTLEKPPPDLCHENDDVE
jgi:hypothetical protein